MNISRTKSDACSIAQKLLDSDDKYVDRVLRMWRLGESIHGQVWETEFHAFGVAASDTDHLPTVKAKNHYSPDALKIADRELRQYIHLSHEDIEKACKLVIALHGINHTNHSTGRGKVRWRVSAETSARAHVNPDVRAPK